MEQIFEQVHHELASIGVKSMDEFLEFVREIRVCARNSLYEKYPGYYTLMQEIDMSGNFLREKNQLQVEYCNRFSEVFNSSSKFLAVKNKIKELKDEQAKQICTSWLTRIIIIQTDRCLATNPKLVENNPEVISEMVKNNEGEKVLLELLKNDINCLKDSGFVTQCIQILEEEYKTVLEKVEA